MPKPRHNKPARPATRKPAAKPVAKARPAAKAKPVAKAKPAPKPAKAGKPARPTKAALRKPAHPARTDAKRAAVVAAVAKQPAVDAGPTSHELAVEVFERGFQALQQRQFGRAAELLNRVVNAYPDEKELQERARVYISICERQRNSLEPSPRSLEERLNAATVAINRGAYADGLALLRKLEADYRDNDYIQYLLCVAYNLLNDAPHALEHLRRAVALNHENRYLATQDADLDPLRQSPGFADALDTPAAASASPAKAAPPARTPAPVKAPVPARAAAPAKAAAKAPSRKK